MGLNEVKKELKKLDKDKLIGLVTDMYKKNIFVKEFLDFYAKPNEQELFDKYKAKVEETFYPKRGFGYNLKAGKKLINDFKKLEPSAELLADLMLVYVETGISFTNDFGDINEAFYRSLASTYTDALMLMGKENLLEKFKTRADTILNDADEIGWGFQDYLIDVYHRFY